MPFVFVKVLLRNILFKTYGEENYASQATIAKTCIINIEEIIPKNTVLHADRPISYS